MGLSAPPASWDTVLNKPTTVSGFGITDMGSQSVANATNATNASNANTVSSITTQQVLNAQSAASALSVGTFANASVGSGELGMGGTTAGSNLRNKDNSGALVNFGVSGTWRNMGVGTSYSSGSSRGTFLRIA